MTSEVARTWARGAAVAVMAIVPLAAWPGLAQPFSTPKLVLLTITAVVLVPFAWAARLDRDRRRPAAASGPEANARPAVQLAAAVWLASWSWSALLADVVSLEALLIALAAGALAIILTELEPDPAHLASAHVFGATGVAGVALLQWAGWDPFALAGWVAPLAGASPRLRVYGTLGNPNFVAALLTGTVPLTIALMVGAATRHPRRAVAAGALVLQLCAIAATGSRAGALGLIAAGLTWILSGPRTWRRRVAVACGLAAVVIIGVSTARPLRETLAGRIYIWQVVWPHAFEAPWVGQGPGAFALLYPGWERAARRRPPTAAAAHYFAGPQQHAHNDYLQALVERGLAGPVTLLLVLTTCLRGGRRAEPLGIGAAAALAALGAVACVDFPLARPAETALWWSCAALLGTPRERTPG